LRHTMRSGSAEKTHARSAVVRAGVGGNPRDDGGVLIIAGVAVGEGGANGESCAGEGGANSEKKTSKPKLVESEDHTQILKVIVRWLFPSSHRSTNPNIRKTVGTNTSAFKHRSVQSLQSHLHSHTVPLVQWSTRLLPIMRDPGSIPRGVLM
jgi:hypothetical protein